MRSTRFVPFVAAALALVAACSSDKKAQPGAPASSVDGLVASLAASGLAPGKLAPVEVARLGGAACRRGDVSGIEMTVCEYEDASRAKKYESEGLALIGDHTGASLAEGKLVLVVADRQNVDKDGKRIGQITRAFRGR